MADLNEALNAELKTKTRKCYAKIKAGFDPKEHVVDTLYQEGIITLREHKEISDGLDKETRARITLSYLFQTSHSQAFVVFREALKHEYGWLVAEIDSTGEYDHLLNSVYW